MMCFRYKLIFVATVLVVAMTPSSLRADEPALQFTRKTVNELTAHGKFLAAVVRYRESEDSRKTLAEKLAAANSAWALGLVVMASSLWDEVLADRDYDGPERYRTILSRAILDIQEGNYDAACATAQRVVESVQDTALKAQFYLLIAESLKLQGARSQAEQYHRLAVSVAEGAAKNEALFLLAENQVKIGLTDAARAAYAQVETDSAFAARALRSLIQIDFQNRKYDGVLMWVSEGRTHHSVEFEDAWTRYVATISLVEQDKLKQAEKELKSFKKWYPDNDSWRLLAEAAVEGANIRAVFYNIASTNSDADKG